MEATMYYSVLNRILFCSYIFTCKCSLHWVNSLVWGLWLLLQYQCWNLTRTPLRYSFVTLYHRDLVTLDKYNQFLHVLQQFSDGFYVGKGQLKALDLDLIGSWIVLSANFPATIGPEWTFLHWLAHPIPQMAKTGNNCVAFMPKEPAKLCSHNQIQLPDDLGGHTSRVLKPVMNGISCLAPTNLEQALPLPKGSNGHMKRIHLAYGQATSWQMRDREKSSLTIL